MTHSQSDNSLPNPWDYFGVPVEDRRDLLQLYAQTHLSNMEDLPKMLEKLTYSPDSPFGRTHIITQSTEATNAAMWFILADFLAMKYFRRKNAHKMRPIPKQVLAFLVHPYNKMTSLDYEDQVRFRDSLPPNEQEKVYIDE